LEKPSIFHIFNYGSDLNMYRCIIIDDEPHAIEGLKRYISSIPELLLIESYTDSLEALKSIKVSDSVDLIFLDIDMPKINGIELSKEIRNKTDKLIFTTAHSKYAYEAFEVDADAFLLKPYSLGKFAITINKLFPQKNIQDNIAKDDFFFVKSKEENLKIVKIKYEDIIAVESKQNYVMIHAMDKKVLTYMSLTEIAKLLKNIPGFVQLHRSFIVKQDKIEAVDGNLVKMTNGIQVTVGEIFRKDFNSFIAGKLIKAGKKS
jgi:DNA-binding LytR/AlgR family response regulator